MTALDSSSGALAYRSAGEVWLKAAETLLNPPVGIPLPWWPTITEYTGGLRAHELTLLCAPTGAGKTQMISCISAQLLLQNVPHFVAPVETGDTDHLIRVAECLEREFLNTGAPVPLPRVKSLEEKYGSLFRERCLNVASYDNRVEVEDMINMLRYQHQAYGCKVAILDNLNFFLKVVSSQMEKAEMDRAIHEFVMLAKKIPMHIVLITHPRKTDNGRVLSEFDIKGSSTAVQEAQNILLFNRPSEEQVSREGRDVTDREVIFRKLRKRGMHVGKPVWLSFQYGRYMEVRA